MCCVPGSMPSPKNMSGALTTKSLGFRSVCVHVLASLEKPHRSGVGKLRLIPDSGLKVSSLSGHPLVLATSNCKISLRQILSFLLLITHGVVNRLDSW